MRNYAHARAAHTTSASATSAEESFAMAMGLPFAEYSEPGVVAGRVRNVDVMDPEPVKIVEPVEEVWYAHVLISEERNARDGWDLRTESYATFELALEAAMEKALVTGSGAVFCDAITIGRTDVAEVNAELDVTFVNDYANPERCHLVAVDETPAEEVKLVEGEFVLVDTRGDMIIVEDATWGLSEVTMITEDAGGHNWVTLQSAEGHSYFWHIDDAVERWGSEIGIQLAGIVDQAHMLNLRKSFNLV